MSEQPQKIDSVSEFLSQSNTETVQCGVYIEKPLRDAVREFAETYDVNMKDVWKAAVLKLLNEGL